MIAGQLEIQIAADVARISRDMQQVQGIVGSAMQNVQRAIAGVTSAFAALGVSLGAGALTAMGKSAIDAADHLNDLSKSTGLAVEQLSGLGIAAKQSGSDLDGVANAVNKLSVNIGQHSEKFRALGVTSKEPLEAFKQLADVFSTIQDPQLRAALGAEALGKNWAAAAPLLAEGGAKIGEMVERGARLAGVTKEMTEQSDAFNDKLVLLTGTHGTLNQVVAQLLPLLNRLADQLLAAKEEAAKLGGTDFSFLLEAGKAIVVLFGNVAFVLKGIGTEIGGIAAQMAALAVGDFKRAGEIGRMMKDDAKAARESFDKWEASIMALGKSTAATTKQLDTGDQVTRRMVSSAEAAARAFIETEKRAKAHAKEVKLAGDADAAWLQWLKMVGDIAESTAKALADGEEAYRKHIQAIDDAIAAEKFANDTRGMTRSQIEGVTIARLEERLAIEQANGAMESDLAMIQREIDKRKQLREVIGNGEVQEAQRRATSQALTDEARAWDEFASRVVRNIGDMGQALKDFLRELLMMVAKKWILQIGANITGNSALASLAGSTGSGTLAGMAGNLLGSTAIGAAGSTFLSAATGSFVGPTMAGTAAGMGSAVYGALMSIPVWGWIVAGLATIAAILAKPRGGPKDEGQFITGGAPGFNIVGTSANGAAEQFATGLATKIAEAIRAFGGTPGSFQVGAGVVRDPSGTAPTFIDTLLRTAGGQELLRQHNANVGRSDEEMQAELELQGQRVILAALQNSALPPMVAGVFNSLVAESATLEEIQAAMTEAGRLQGLWTSFQQSFSTDAEKLADAQKIVGDVFAKLGRDVPKDMEAFKAAVREAWESGDAETFEALMSVGNAFQFVTDTASDAAKSIQDDWNQVAQLLGIGGSGGDLAAQFAANNPWAAGKSIEQLIADFKTITEEDFKGYSAENRKLIIAILGLADTVEDAAETISQAIYLPEQGAQGLAGQFDQRFGGLINAEPDMLSRLSLTSRLMTEQIAQWRAAQVGLSEYSAEWQTFQNAIDGFMARLVTNSADIARLTILEAQYGKEKGEQLFALEQWYHAQQALVAGNQAAMDALDQIFHDRWQDILDGITSQADSARDRLRDWWNGLFLNQQLSPLTPQQRLAEAEKQYRDTLALAQGGDATAIGNLAGASQTYLEIARQVFASSAAYTAIFRQVAEETGLVAQISQADINAKLYSALPSTSMASDEAVFTVRDELRNLQSQLASMTLKTKDEVLAEKIDRLTTATETREGALAR